MGCCILLVVGFATIRMAAAQTGTRPIDTHQPDPARWATGESILESTRLLNDGTRGLTALYNMEYEAADSIFERIENQFAGHPVGPFLRALVVWWRILPKLEMGATGDDVLFYDAMERVIDWSDQILKLNPDHFDAMLFKGAALGFRGRLKSNRREWLSAALDGRSTLDYIFRIAESDSTNADYQFGRGVYDYFASIIPERYPQVKPLMYFFPEADRERGLKNLAFTAASGRFIRTEAVYFLLQIHLFYEPNFVESRRRIDWLRLNYPKNAYFHVLEGRVYARWSQWQEAVGLFKEVVSRHDAGETGYNDVLTSQALYYIGRFDMENGRLEDGLESFDRIRHMGAEIPTDTFFKVNATLRTGMIYDLQGKREEAITMYQDVLKMEDQGGSRERAKEYRRNAYQIE